ncbi:MAG TPA: hypothetical protein VG323_08955, partial [Thermoanaerobaculia bacterium]|nr:hypothetical protein [Thermoanaerobaculia bacterium]
TDFSGTYTVAVDDGAGCSTSASVTVTVNDFALARVPAAACPNALIQNVEIVGATGAYSWNLTNGTIVNNYGRNIDLTIDGTAPAVVTASVDTGNGCVMSQSATIAVASPLSSATVSAASSTICQGSSTTVTATPAGGSGSYTVVWHAYGDTVNVTTPTITVSPATNAWYYADVTDNYGCGSVTTNAVQVTVTPVSAAITAPDNACTNVISTASGPEFSASTTYAWSIDGGGTIAWGQGSTGIGFTPGPNGSTLSLTVNNSGCTASSSKFVGALPVPAQPTITASGPTTFCAPGSVTLTSSPANTYSWSTGETTQQIVVSTSGSYSVTVQSAAGCTSASSQPVVVTAMNPPFAAVSGGGSVCAGGSTTIGASLSGAAPFSVTWSDGVTQNIASGTTATRTVAPSSSTNYTVTSISDASGCTGSSGGNAYVAVHVPPAAAVSGSTTICAGSSATITASLTVSGYPVNVTWSDGFTQQITSGTSATRTVSPAANTTYTVTSVSDPLCAGTSSGSATVTVDVAPTITTQPASVTIRKNSSTTLSVMATSPRPISYQWYTGTSGNTSSPIAGATGSSYQTPRLSATTSYWVRVSNSCGATNSATATVTVH